MVMFKEKVYLGGGSAASDRDEQTVMVYDPKQDSYDTLPQYMCKCFSLAAVNNQLVLVGGQQSGKRTNKLGVWNEQSKGWTHPLPPMTTACNSPSVITHNRWLVVIGGTGDGDGTLLSRVEILDTTESRQWFLAASLPQPCTQVSPVTIGNMCYLLGGFTKGVKGVTASKKAFSVCLDNLISQAVCRQSNASPPRSPWQELTDTPQTYTTTLAFNGALLTIGVGFSGSKAIYHYQPSSRRWTKAGELPTKRYQCICTVLPSGDLYVAGGGGGVFYDSQYRSVDIASGI